MEYVKRKYNRLLFLINEDRMGICSSVLCRGVTHFICLSFDTIMDQN